MPGPEAEMSCWQAVATDPTAADHICFVTPTSKTN